ncbi:zinc-ribbon domain-containing protein [Levilactobacillus tangyuanensis]|uniref:Zinc-ribbon domain-containing protein n=1 Tax=Levilactobacillus tangyuanensis TaxID=2486021 RepID=A0ABW1TLG4_9LACO|nr:zinc ribbon domain-containing protein [Levilactobacillus tangyuanensis]
MAEKFCPNCGASVPVGAAFCRNCGHQFKTQVDAQATGATDNADSTEPVTTPAPTPQTPESPQHKWLVIIGAVIGLAVVIVITMSVVFQKQQEAKQRAEEASVSRKSSSKAASESRVQSREKSLATDAVDPVTDVVQNQFDLDAKCTDVTIESKSGNQYMGYAKISDDYDDETSVDVTVTDVKYDKSVSVYIDGDDHTKLTDTFTSNDDDDDY